MLPAIATAFALLTLALLVIGWRGMRVSDHPHCRKCRFDLEGVWPGSEGQDVRCPECGTELTDKRVRSGLRRTRRLPLALGTLCLLVLLGAGSAIGVGISQNFDFNTIKPVWWLLADARSGDVPREDAALNELLARQSSGSLSNAGERRVVKAALAVQADFSLPWTYAWGDLVESARKTGVVTDDQWFEFLKNTAPTTRMFPEKVRLGEGVPTRTVEYFRGGRASSAYLWYRDVEYWLDGELLGQNFGGPGGGTHSSGGWWFQGVTRAPAPGFRAGGSGGVINAFPAPDDPSVVYSDRKPATVGKHVLRVVTVRRLKRQGARAPNDGPFRSLDTRDRSYDLADVVKVGLNGNAATWIDSYEQVVEVVPEDAEIIELIDDPELLAQLQDSARCEGISVQSRESQFILRAPLKIEVSDLPDDVALYYQAYLLAGEREWGIGAVHFESRRGEPVPGAFPQEPLTDLIYLKGDKELNNPEHHWWGLEDPSIRQLSAESGVIELRPDPRGAEKETTGWRIPRDVIRIENVPIVYE